MAEVKLFIDGKEVSVPRGATILHAAGKAGVRIPTLCHHPDLEPYGGCRLCIVKVEGMRGMPPSCITEAAPDMKVITEDDEILDARRTVLKLLLADHPYDCLRCRANLNCELQKLCEELGVREHGLIPVLREGTIDESSPVFARDMNRCVRCARCIRTCQEVLGLGAIDFIGRGHVMEVGPFANRPIKESICEACGECVVRCPTGALAFKRERPRPEKKVSVVCPYCGTGCSIELEIRRGRVVSASGDRRSPVNRGVLCVKGRSGAFDFLHHKDRLTKPLVRKNGQLVEASWEEALSLVAEKFAQFRGEQFAALASAKVSCEDNYLMQKFTRAVQASNNVDHCARLCHASSVAGLALSFGSGAMTNPASDLDLAQVILVTGSNTTENHPIIGQRIRRAAMKGARLIVIDPRDIQLASRAAVWLRQKPGSDVALFNSMMHVIIRENLADLEYVKNRTEGFEELRAVIEKYPPARGAEISGVPAEDIVKAARLYASGKPASICYSMGITQHVTGTDSVRTLANLAMLCGNVGKEGGGVNPLRGQNNVQGACDMGCLPNVFSGYQQVADPALRQKMAEAWGVPVEKLAEKPGLTMTEMLDAVEAGKVKAFYIMGENPMIADPDINHVEKALRATQFLVVQDIFLTETARLAHVVLPAAAYAEKEGTFTNTERRVQLSRQAVEPPGEARPDWLIITQLARLLGHDWGYRTHEDVFAEIARVTPQYGGISYERLRRGELLAWPCPTPDHPGTPILHREKFTRGLGKFFAIEYLPPAELPDKDFPWVLTTGRQLEHFHTGTMSRKSPVLHALAPGPYVELNSRDAERLGICDGGKVVVKSRRGSIELEARVGELVEAGVVFIPFHYVEAAANCLTNRALDPVAKIPELKVCAVRLERAN